MLLLGSVLNYSIYLRHRDRNKYVRVNIGKSRFDIGIHRKITTIILTEYGGAVCLKNRDNICKGDLDKIIEVIEANHRFICDIWEKTFNKISFYC